MRTIHYLTLCTCISDVSDICTNYALLCITVQETLSSTGKAISLHLLAVHGLEIVIVILTVQTVQLNSSVIMSWAKQSADAGLAGLHEWEAARGVMGRRWT